MGASSFSGWWKQAGEAELRQILMEQWDPIGVKHFPGAADEYDGYFGQIIQLLREAAPAQRLAEHLSAVERAYMGFSTQPDELMSVGQALKRWYADSMTRWKKAAS